MTGPKSRKPNPPSKPDADKKAKVDWDALRPHYEAGVIPLKTLGKQFGCSDAAIIKHAAKQVPPWTRNLMGRIQAAADAKVASRAVSAQVSEKGKALTEAVVDGNAELQANIRLEHRKDIKKARALTVRMLGELEGAGTGKKKLDLPQRALVVKNLTEAMRVQVGLERQAFGIDDRDIPPPESTSFHERLIHARQRAASC